MGEFKRHWIALIAILIVTFSLLGWGGSKSIVPHRLFPKNLSIELVKW